MKKLLKFGLLAGLLLSAGLLASAGESSESGSSSSEAPRPIIIYCDGCAVELSHSIVFCSKDNSDCTVTFSPKQIRLLESTLIRTFN